MRSSLLLLLSLCALSSLPATVQGVASVPAFAPSSAEYENQVTVRIVSKDSEAIYYTLDGTEPTASNPTAKRYVDAFSIATPGTTTVKAVAAYNNNASLTAASQQTYAVVKIFEGVATVGGHLTDCVVGLDVAGGLVSTSPISLLPTERSASTTAGAYRLRSLRSGTGGVVLDTVTAFASAACQDTATGEPPALPLTSPCPQTLTPLTTAAAAAMAAGGMEAEEAVAATAAVVGVPLAAPICGFNDAPRRAQDGDPLGITSLARGAQVQALAAYAAAAIHGVSGKNVSIRDAGAAAFNALGIEIARRQTASTSASATKHHRRSLLTVSTASRINWASSDEMKRVLEAAAAALPSGSLPSPWGTGSGAETVSAVERLLHADTTSLDSLAKELTPTASDLAQVQRVVGAFSTSIFEDVVALGEGSISLESFEYKYALRTRPSPPPPNPPPPPPPQPPSPPPAFKQIAPLNDSVGGVPIWTLIVIVAIVLFGTFLGCILYYRRVRKGRKARGESDPDFGDDLRSPGQKTRGWFRRSKDGSGSGGGMEDELTGVHPTMQSDAAMAAAAAGGGGRSMPFARPDLARPGVLSRKDNGSGVSGVFARPDLAEVRRAGGGAGGGVGGVDDDTGEEARTDVGSYGAEDMATGSYEEEVYPGGGAETGTMLRWDTATQSWTRDRHQQRGGGGGAEAPGAVASPSQQQSVSFGRPPSMKLKKGGGGGGGGAKPWAGASGSGLGPSPPQRRQDGEFVRRAAPMNPAVVDAMSRREVIRALETRGVEHEDLLEDDAEDEELRRRLKLHACASRHQMEAAEAAATEATRREYEKTLETPAEEWFN